MILIITHKRDFTVDFVINNLNKEGIPYKRLNCEDILEYPWSISIKDTFNTSMLGEKSFRSVWFRRTMLPDLNHLPLEDRNYVLKETEYFLDNLFSILDVKWVSIPYKVYHAENKLLQLKTAAALGFLLPDTLVTNQKNELTSFYKKHQGNIIVKPLGVTRSQNGNNSFLLFTNMVPEEMISNIKEYDLTPCIFQEYIDKDIEIRATVIGKQVFAAKVDSQAHEETKVDWRRERLPFQVFSLPQAISDLCIKLVDTLGLRFGAIDLIRKKDGAYVFLEINPNGQWVWIEQQTGLPLTKSLIKELA
ncbi:hypothetical protein [Echinicola sp. 20G]|uniref:hypothetical protein n=1 Tax=Echinicola sp. 20G TaxID=2781961 RepID=UPI001910E5ED|nr:hypothetical protein [Echinicola sp. 20G]